MCRAFVALFDMLCFSFLFAGIFDLLPRAIIPPFLSNSGRDTFADLSRIFAIRAMTANGANLLQMNAFYNLIDPWLGLGAQTEGFDLSSNLVRGIIVVRRPGHDPDRTQALARPQDGI